MQVEISMIGNMKDTWHLANVNAGGVEQRHAMLIPLLRGQASTHHVRWSSSFPLGLWLREKFSEFAHDLTIFPYPQRTKTLSFAGRARDAASPYGDPFSRGGGEWRGLRAWRAGDSPQRIHVAASSRSHARGTGLMVSECDPPGHLPQCVVVAFHSHAHDGALIRPEVFEQALSQLCGILTFLTSQGIPALFLADFDHWLERHCDNRAQLTEIFHLLAKTRRHAGTERHDLARIRAQYESEDCWVVVSDMAAESWRHLFVAKGVIIHCLSPLTRRPS